MTRRLGLGLRAQIILALCAVFALSFALLGLTAVRLTRRAVEVDHLHASELLAQTLASAVEQASGRTDGHTDAELEQLVDRLLDQVPGSALRIERGDKTRLERGNIPASGGVEVELSGGGRLHLWLARTPSKASSPLTNLLLFYVALTGVAVVLLTYVALTRWIVRPIDSLIHWSERLAAGAQQADLPERAAAEITRLAISFNQMAATLQAQRLSLEHRLEELETATAELQTAERQVIHGEKLATVGRLAAGVAHEVGNPLSGILGLVELLQSGDLTEEEQAEFLQRIRQDTERINQIIRDLLDFSRRGMDAEELGVTSDLKRAVQDAVNLVSPLKEMRDVDLQVQPFEALPRVVGSQPRLTQVVLNLLLNAADALDGKGVITVEAHPMGMDRVSLVISDSGPGIAPEMMDRLFEPFTTTKPSGKGTGLGLAVCHTLIERLGGTVTATNPPEGGARFEVELKAQRLSSASGSYTPVSE